MALIIFCKISDVDASGVRYACLSVLTVMRATLRSLSRPAGSLRAASPANGQRRALLSSTRPSALPRVPAQQRAVRTSRGSRRSSTSSSAPPAAPSDEPSNEPSTSTATKAIITKDKREKPVPPSLPFNSDNFWSADELAANPPPASSLPPPDILDEALNNLAIALHPQTQHRAAYGGGAPEPSLHLYSPLEGGDYVLDDTVRELARRTGADVVVLDAAHMAAGAFGRYGSPAALLSFPGAHPLHFAATPSSPTRRDEDNDDMDEQQMMAPGMGMMGMPQMMLQVIPTQKQRSQQPSNPPQGAPRVFFDLLINASIPPTPNTDDQPQPRPRRPRIIYIRDFPTLAGSAPSWYPALQSAARARRQGALASSTAPVECPTVLVFGSTPSVTSSAHNAATPAPSLGGRGTHAELVLRREPPSGAASSSTPSTNKPVADAEDDAAERARERRLKDRLKRWERGPSALENDIPRLSLDDTDSPRTPRGNGLMIVRELAGAFGSRMPNVNGSNGTNEPNGEGGFFRTSILVPETRQPIRERETRVSRRREINALTTRMAVGAVGGALPALYVSPAGNEAEEGQEDEMWVAWGRHMRSWAAVQRTADRAVGGALRAGAESESGVVAVGWADVRRAWSEERAAKEARRGWVRGAGREDDKDGELLKEGAKEDDKAVEEPDALVEEVRNDPELDAHTQRLLGCIVDRASMRTTFSQVHLPPTTIDAVRTMASLPLLHPHAFAHGILREHAMTGLLLFGPPGTGKTLVVRALAREAGTRMLAIAPSDVMDMYVGEGEKLVRAVFALARRLAPCIVFLDELDALFGARSGHRDSGGAAAHRGVLTEFMQEMDGLRSAAAGQGVVVIGATNRPFDLDDAVLRRLPRRLLVDLPGEKEREAILRILLKEENVAEGVDVAKLAKDTVGFSGSDLKHLAVAAALDAVKESVELPWRKTAEGATTTPEVEVSATTELPTEPKAAVYEGLAAGTTAEAVDAEAPHHAGDPSSSTSAPTDATPATSSTLKDPAPTAPDSATVTPQRILSERHFTRALKEITPSASEHLGTLSDLRKWNDEFGDGAHGRRKRKTAVWGKDRFGFTNRTGKEADPGRVVEESNKAGEAGK
ncbi:AAA-domain-containing protein [Peniophora sp. CONT]|nr:AAA-domain-containing protein [Peniophora sp. CONT]